MLTKLCFLKYQPRLHFFSIVWCNQPLIFYLPVLESTYNQLSVSHSLSRNKLNKSTRERERERQYFHSLISVWNLDKYYQSNMTYTFHKDTMRYIHISFIHKNKTLQLTNFCVCEISNWRDFFIRSVDSQKLTLTNFQEFYTIMNRIVLSVLLNIIIAAMILNTFHRVTESNKSTSALNLLKYFNYKICYWHCVLMWLL